MGKTSPKKAARIRRKTRIRGKIYGTMDQPRLAVFRSARHIYAQVINDDLGQVLASASSMDRQLKDSIKYGGNVEAAGAVGKLLAERATEKKIEKVRFDRGGFRYHGRVKALAEAAREGGLKF